MKTFKEFIKEGKVHQVPAYTFSDKPKWDPAAQERHKSWLERKAKVEIEKHPEKQRADQEMPIIDSEFGTRLFDKELVDYVKSEYKKLDSKFNWGKLSELDQIKCQLDFIAPPPRKGDTLEKIEAALDKRAKALQAKIKRHG